MTENALSITQNGLPIFNSATGQFDAVELTTKGDILSRTTTLYSREPVGTDGQALISQSSTSTGLDYSAATAGSSVIFLQSQTASGSTSIDFTTPFDDSTYLYYLFTYINVRPSTDGEDLRVRMSINGGSTYLSSDYQYVRKRYSSSSGSDTLTGDTSASNVSLATSIGNAAGEGLSGRLILIPSNDPHEDRPIMFLHDNNFIRTDGTWFRNFGNGQNETASIVNGLRFYMSSGNIANGIFTMYGVTKS